jgi:uncharacterized protein (DUF1810 family)
MWFVFPQLRGPGRSAMATFYGIGSLHEARAYPAHPLLGPRYSTWRMGRCNRFSVRRMT